MSDQMLLSARGLTKRFGAVTVVDDVTFDVPRGQVLGILGPNGAGKTTLFNLISGDLTENGGELSLDGSRLSAEPPYKRCQRGIGRTYQVPQPFGDMTAFENLMVPAMMSAKMSEAEASEYAAEVLRDCGLLPRANKLAGGLTLLDRKRLEL
ncbi:MAG TPA: ABC transporter ATP-binding protein, partial [Maritimibacter sp.]|nr:ABC transporter ATP-binding protein [Maritimibacter sp.]